MNLLRSLFRYLINSNIFVSVAAVALTLETLVLYGLQPKLDAAAVLVFFSTLFIYTISRIRLLPGHPLVESLRIFPEKIRATLSLGGAMIAFSQISYAAKLSILPLAIISLGYALPLFRSKTRYFRLREIPMLKIFMIAWVWGITTVLIPLLDKDVPVFNGEVFLILLRRMLYIFAITVPFDIRDHAEDARNNLKTLPGAFGIQAAKMIAASALLLFIGLLFINVDEKNQFSILCFYGFPLMLSSFIAGIFIYKTSPSRSTYYYLFFLDGTMILQFLLVLIWRSAFIK